MEAYMRTGKVKWFNEDKRFGFITGDDGVDVFVHLTDLVPGQMIREGDSVRFDLADAKKGQKAVNIQVI